MVDILFKYRLRRLIGQVNMAYKIVDDLLSIIIEYPVSWYDLEARGSIPVASKYG